MHESFCVLSMKGSVPRICKNIFKKVSKKNRNFQVKIGYNPGCGCVWYRMVPHGPVWSIWYHMVLYSTMLHGPVRSCMVPYCQTPVLGLGLGVDFTFAEDNNNNHNHNHNNPHLNFLKGTVLADKEQGVGLMDK